ncbi:MAG TPA: hypothetical protein VKB76_06010, partial [Ktedonobacterales bacterium]|nr:hypothetical protein [Ktedonobacterales bacterium]
MVYIVALEQSKKLPVDGKNHVGGIKLNWHVVGTYDTYKHRALQFSVRSMNLFLTYPPYPIALDANAPHCGKVSGGDQRVFTHRCLYKRGTAGEV